MTFYETEQNLNSSFRLGDVLKGVILSSPEFSTPHNSPKDFTLKITQPSYAVILTPCCSIEDNTVLVAPLEKIPKRLLKNPTITEDFTIINEKISNYDALPPEDQDSLAPEDACKLKQQWGYVFLSFFIYKPNEEFQEYQLKYKEQEFSIKHYMINFKKMYKINCSVFNRKMQKAQEIKFLQLSISTRKLLREKLAHYYGRIPDEDKPKEIIKKTTPEGTCKVSPG